MVDHYEVHATFSDIEHQVPENILYHFLCYSFLIKSEVSSIH